MSGQKLSKQDAQLFVKLALKASKETGIRLISIKKAK